MAKIGTADPSAVGGPAPMPGVPHFATKQISAPKARQNMLNVRVSPLKRMTAAVKPVKPDGPSNIGNF